jgi:predicted dienelactone hydrolase
MSRTWRVVTLVVIVVASACGGGASPDLSVEGAGAYEVGTTRIELVDASRARALTAQLWYPAGTAAAGASAPIEMLEAEPHRAQYAGLLAAATSCPNRTAHAAIDTAPQEPPADAPAFPLIAFSHCHDCARFSEMTVAERLASHGFVVVAVDHTGNTVYDHLAGHEETIGTAFLDVRTADIRFAIDQVLAGAHPPGLAIDASAIGVFGHSFGAVTAGAVAQADPRIGAAAAIAAPMDNPLIPGVDIAQLHVPLLFVVAREDNSITELGNKLLRGNFTDAAVPAWKLEVADAGHWSFSDMNGAADVLMAGCGSATRQTDGTDFAYLDPPTGRALAAAYVTAFFRATLRGDDGARAYLDSARPAELVTSAHRN